MFLNLTATEISTIIPSAKIFLIKNRYIILGAAENMRLTVPTWSEAQRVLTRKKVVVLNEKSHLAKVLTTLDLTALGVGSTLGVGVYVLAGDVAKKTAGPAVIISFFIAAVASVLAGLCYAEFGARVPKAGSAYVYSYVCVGEFFAFIIGWNLILEYLIVDASNWNKTKEEAGNYGEGGFAPYGIKGIIKGAARCFYGFIGFDCIATAGEEAKTPQKSIPIGVVMSLLIVFFAYFGMSTVLTMILPYYEQDENAPLPHIYNQLGWTVIKYIVSVGAICGLFSSLLGAMFPLPRIIYAMACDGLLFKTLGKVHPTFHTPFMGTLIAGAFAVLRYSVDSADKKYEDNKPIEFKQYFKQIFNRNTVLPTNVTSSVVSWEIISYFVFCFILSGLMTGFEDDLYNGTPWLIAVCSVLVAVGIILLTAVPLVPWIPGISIFINIYLMTNIQRDTWIKYAYWVLIGLLIYFAYGLWHSTERSLNKRKDEEKQNFEDINNLTSRPECSFGTKTS
ncbi:hypothetical protein NQ314_003192 [Rhamnusium bicolor]|uniref:Cationic amino acid transporter C-terminal domain-containing protein n=1 Tax=Rhamnusium bicolor TaxID=1586634 RepID=A0AAV8ZML2_9CUCU|nr:hypothetical protein NQ314_003192 [Rhamnusium bicolor]